MSNHLYFNNTDGTYLYLCLEDPPKNKLDNKFKADSKFWNDIFINKVLI